MNNKKNISVRLLESDLRRIKEVSSKLGVKDSDFFRYAVKVTLGNLMPLMRRDIQGAEFLLALLDGGDNLLRHFEFDSHMLERIVNDGVAVEDKVSMMDVELVCIASVNERYMVSQLKSSGENLGEGDPIDMLKKYLSDKYMSGNLVEKLKEEPKEKSKYAL